MFPGFPFPTEIAVRIKTKYKLTTRFNSTIECIEDFMI